MLAGAASPRAAPAPRRRPRRCRRAEQGGRARGAAARRSRSASVARDPRRVGGDGVAALRRQVPAFARAGEGVGARAAARAPVPLARRAVGPRGGGARVARERQPRARARARSISCAPSKASSVSSTTWTTREVASSAARAAPRAVARGRGAARRVDDGARRFDRRAARAGAAARRRASRRFRRRRAHLHWLLFTPFRYPPPPGGSRFRGPNDPGVFYGADEMRTACAELGYWRWRHLQRLAGARPRCRRKPQTVFQARVATDAVDLRDAAVRARSRRAGPIPPTIRGCQRFGRTAREAGVGAIRYESVRDPQHGGCCAVLVAGARSPGRRRSEQQTWMLSVDPRSRRLAAHATRVRAEEHEFAAPRCSRGATP